MSIYRTKALVKGTLQAIDNATLLRLSNKKRFVDIIHSVRVLLDRSTSPLDHGQGPAEIRPLANYEVLKKDVAQRELGEPALYFVVVYS